MVLASGADVWTWPRTFWLYLGGIGPPLAGIVMTAWLYGAAGMLDLWRRLIEVTRIPWRWYAVILLLPPVLLLLAVAVRWSLEGDLAFDVEAFRSQFASPLRLLSFAAFILVLGPLPEEIGWRGYALDRLQERFYALWSSIVLGLAWAAWHIPLFLMAGYYARFGATPGPAVFTYDILLNATLYTWIYNNTNRSLLAAVLFHFVINFSGELLPGSDQATGWSVLLKTVVVAIVLSSWGPRHLVCGASPQRRYRMVRKFLLVCGILSSILYVAMNVFIPMQWQGYGYASQTVSELPAIGAPTRSLWVPLGILYSVLIGAFGWGVSASAVRNLPLRIVGGLMIAYGVISVLWPPMHLRGTEFTMTDAMHIGFAIVAVVLMMLAIGFGAVAFGKPFRLYSIATLVIFVVFGALAGAPGSRQICRRLG